jgi:hypothetical protein
MIPSEKSITLIYWLPVSLTASSILELTGETPRSQPLDEKNCPSLLYGIANAVFEN